MIPLYVILIFINQKIEIKNTYYIQIIPKKHINEDIKMGVAKKNKPQPKPVSYDALTPDQLLEFDTNELDVSDLKEKKDFEAAFLNAHGYFKRGANIRCDLTAKMFEVEQIIQKLNDVYNVTFLEESDDENGSPEMENDVSDNDMDDIEVVKPKNKKQTKNDTDDEDEEIITGPTKPKKSTKKSNNNSDKEDVVEVTKPKKNTKKANDDVDKEKTKKVTTTKLTTKKSVAKKEEDENDEESKDDDEPVGEKPKKKTTGKTKTEDKETPAKKGGKKGKK